MKLFVSYAHSEREFVAEFTEILRNEALDDIWWDRHLLGADIWWEQILDQIEACDCMISVLTPDGVSSQFCITELNYALALNKPILPLMQKTCDLPSNLSPIQYIPLQDLSLELTIIRTLSALRSIERKILNHEYRSPVVNPKRPLKPGGLTTPKLLDMFSGAEEAISIGNTTMATNLLNQIIQSDPDNLGNKAKDTLDKLHRKLDYENIRRLVQGHDEEAAKRDWQSYIRRYGTSFDPDNYATSTISEPPSITAGPIIYGYQANLMFSPDGLQIAFASQGCTLLSQIATPTKQRQIIKGQRNDGMVFSQDGQAIAFASHTGFTFVVRIWNIAEDKELKVLSNNKASIQGLAYSPDGHLLALGSIVGMLGIWDMVTDERKGGSIDPNLVNGNPVYNQWCRLK